MRKWTGRLISLLIALSLFAAMIPVGAVSLLPVQTETKTSEPERITQQIKTIYRRALRWNGGSMAGYCGRASDYQVYLLGINAHLEFRDGKDQFDRYKNETMTDGGYYIHAYPAASYDLESGLNAICYDGTRDVYNILVGFQWTNTAAGGIYGHTCFIHAILDGQVYFTESYNMYLDGRFYAEGEPAVCSIAAFAEYYNRWTRFDGLIHFAEESYVDKCTAYPSSLLVQTVCDTPVQTQPIGSSETSATVRTAHAGDRLTVTGLYQNTEGAFWYRVEENYTEAFVSADDVKVLDFIYEDVKLEGVSAPGRLWKGNGFTVRGELSTVRNVLSGATVRIYSRADGTVAAEHTVDLNCHSYSLSQPEMNNSISFTSLEFGDYIYKILATTENYYIRNGQLALREKEHTLWTSNFVVNHSSSISKSITFDPCGGETSVNKMPVVYKEGLAFLPTATREGYHFDGWYLEDGTRVTLETTFRKDTTVYAHWTAAAPTVNGWHQIDGQWYYYKNGQRLTGWFTEGDTTYFLTDSGLLCSGWAEIQEKRYYFCASGAMLQGWMELGGDRYYLDEDGAAATQWLDLNGVDYFFLEDGTMQTGWVEVDGQFYYLQSDGAKATGTTLVEGNTCQFDLDGSLIASWVESGEFLFCQIYDREQACRYVDHNVDVFLLQ